MPKINQIRMIAVYSHAQSLAQKPMMWIPRDEARWWIDSGAARSCCRGRAIQLIKIKSISMLGQSAKMGPRVMDGVVRGNKFFLKLLAAWRPGAVKI